MFVDILVRCRDLPIASAIDMKRFELESVSPISPLHISSRQALQQREEHRIMRLSHGGRHVG